MREQVIKAVCVATEATDYGCLDTEAMGTKELLDYWNTREFKVLKFKPGSHPLVFHVTEVPNDYWANYVMAADTDTERAERAFRCSVVRVENMPQDDGVRVGDWTPPNINGKHKPMSESDAVKFSPAERLEIGGVAFTHSFLPRRIDACFRPHALLVEALAHTTLRLVGVSPTAAAETSSETPSHASGSSPSPDATASDSGTAEGTSG